MGICTLLHFQMASWNLTAYSCIELPHVLINFLFRFMQDARRSHPLASFVVCVDRFAACPYSTAWRAHRTVLHVADAPTVDAEMVRSHEKKDIKICTCSMCFKHRCCFLLLNIHDLVSLRLVASWDSKNLLTDSPVDHSESPPRNTDLIETLELENLINQALTLRI